MNALQDHVSSLCLMSFYVKRPARMWRHVEMHLPSYLSLHPEFCGNFDRSAGRPPGAKSYAIALWSPFHERGLSRIGALIPAALLVAIVGGGLVLILTPISSPIARRSTELFTCLAACCLTAFLAPAFGDAYDNAKHQFLFNLLLDTCFIFALAGHLPNRLAQAGP